MSLGNAIRVLSVCNDDHLALSRGMVLENAGYAVESRSAGFQFTAAFALSIQVAILCHSVGTESATRLTQVLREFNAKIRVIRIGEYTSKLPNDFDGTCSVYDGPEGLLRSVQSVLDEK